MRDPEQVDAPSSYRPLSWVEDFDDLDNSKFEAASTVYSANDDSLCYRLTQHLEGGRVVWKADESDSELLHKSMEQWRTLDDAKLWCETQNMEAFELERENTVEPLIALLRDYNNCPDIAVDEALQMLAFFFGQMQMHSPDMGGNHCWRFHHGWPMTHCRGSNAVDAVRNAIAEIKRSNHPETPEG